MHFHTPNLNLGQGEPKLLAFQLVFLSYCQWAKAFSLNLRLKVMDATDLESKGAYGIRVLSQKKYAKISQKACFQLISQAKR